MHRSDYGSGSECGPAADLIGIVSVDPDARICIRLQNHVSIRCLSDPCYS